MYSSFRRWFAKAIAIIKIKDIQIPFILVRNYDLASKKFSGYVELFESIRLKWAKDPRDINGKSFDIVPFDSVKKRIHVIPDFDCADYFFVNDEIKL